MKYVVLIGRILFSSIFIIKSIDHFSKESINYAANSGVPLATILVPIAGIIAFLGGISILLGYKARLGAWLIIIFLIPTTLMMHQFWSIGDVYDAMMHQYCFMKNVSMIGGALMISYFGSGPMSLTK
ncbi:MAG: DoxX family protein [Chlamydiales bacterium]|nr:DoxX family protein [Chlamydiales bacterium]